MIFRSSKIGFLIFLVFLIIAAQSRKLVMVHQIFRHGARYPIHSNNKDKSNYAKDERNIGQLTLQGKHMQYILGKNMYDQYWAQLFQGTDYFNKYHPSQFYVKSTNINRTIQSAEAQLLGLLEQLSPSKLPIEALMYSLPPIPDAMSYQQQGQNATEFDIYGGINTDFHTIPIHMQKQSFVPQSSSYSYRANPYDQGDFLVKYQAQNCPNQKFWGKQNYASDQAMRVQNSKQVTQFIQELSKQLDKSVEYEEASDYIDNYYCQKFMGRQYLSLFNNKEYQKTADFILLTSTIFDLFFTEEQIKVTNTAFLQTILYNMKQRIINQGPAMVLYSAHDTTILGFGSALNFLNMDCLIQYFYDGIDNSDTCINQFPVFASNYVIQLWQEDNLSHSISIVYNGVSRKIPICNYKTSCSFSEFQNWVNDFVIDDPNKACGIRQQYLKLYIVIALLSILAFVVIILYLKSKYKKKFQAEMREMEEKKGYIQQLDQKELPSGKGSEKE